MLPHTGPTLTSCPYESLGFSYGPIGNYFFLNLNFFGYFLRGHMDVEQTSTTSKAEGGNESNVDVS